jgi:hypothetical protein
MTSPTNEQQRVDVRRVIEDAARRLYVMAETAEDNEASGDLLQAGEDVAELIEATSALCGQIEFRIDDPRNAMRDRVVTALASVGAQK